MLSRMEHNSNNVRELSLFPDDDTESEERQEVDKIDLQPLFDRLAKSKFRSSFYLNAKEKYEFHSIWQAQSQIKLLTLNSNH